MARVNELFVGIGGSANPLMAAAGQGVTALQSITSSIGGLQAAAGAYAAAIAGNAAISSTVSFIKSGLDAADAQAEFADKLGVSVQGLSELQYAAKLSDTEAEALNASLAKLGVNLANMDDNAGKGLSQLGLSFDDLKNDDLTTAFKKIVAELGKVDSASARTAIAMKLFGKGAVEIRGLLAQGSDGLASLIAEGHELGVIVDDISGARAAAAKDAIDRLESAVEGLSIQLAVGLAPAIETVSVLLTDKLTSDSMQQAAKDAEFWSAALATVADIGYAIQKVFQGLWIAVQAIGNVLQSVVSWSAQGITALTGLGKETTEFLKGMEHFSDENLRNSAIDFDNWDFPSESINKKLDEIKNRAVRVGGDGANAIGQLGDAFDDAGKEASKLLDSAEDLLTQLKQDIQFHGLDATDKKIAIMADKLKNLEVGLDTKGAEAKLDALGHKINIPTMPAGKAADWEAEAKSLAEELKVLDERKKQREADEAAAKKQREEWEQQAEAVKKSIMTPGETAKAEFEKLETLFNQGLLSETEFTKGTDKLGKDLIKDNKPQFAGAALAGSQEARDAILRHQFPQQDKEISLLQQSLKAQREMVIALKRQKDAEVKQHTTYVVIP